MTICLFLTLLFTLVACDDDTPSGNNTNNTNNANNVVEGTEVCDGTDLDGQTCQSRGFTGGSLAHPPA